MIPATICRHIHLSIPSLFTYHTNWQPSQTQPPTDRATEHCSIPIHWVVHPYICVMIAPIDQKPKTFYNSSHKFRKYIHSHTGHTHTYTRTHTQKFYGELYMVGLQQKDAYTPPHPRTCHTHSFTVIHSHSHSFIIVIL